MRGIVLVAAIAACAALSSCGQDQQTAQTGAPAAPTCACRPTAPQETAAAAQTATPIVHRRHHRWRGDSYSRMAWNEHHGWRGDYARTNFTQSVLASYNYVSHSTVSYSGNDMRDERGENYDSGAHYGDYETRERAPVWRETVAATMTGERLDPWYGYDVNCPN